MSWYVRILGSENMLVKARFPGATALDALTQAVDTLTPAEQETINGVRAEFEEDEADG